MYACFIILLLPYYSSYLELYAILTLKPFITINGYMYVYVLVLLQVIEGRVKF